MGYIASLVAWPCTFYSLLEGYIASLVAGPCTFYSLLEEYIASLVARPCTFYSIIEGVCHVLKLHLVLYPYIQLPSVSCTRPFSSMYHVLHPSLVVCIMYYTLLMIACHCSTFKVWIFSYSLPFWTSSSEQQTLSIFINTSHQQSLSILFLTLRWLK